MKKIKNIGIAAALNQGQVIDLYETADELIYKFGGRFLPKHIREQAEMYLKIPGIIGFVETDYGFIQVYNNRTDEYEIVKPVKKSKQTMIREHFEAGRSLTCVTCWELYKTMRLPEYVRILKKRGLDIETIMVPSETSADYAKYKMR
jgi:hypothetical protein